MRITSGRFRNRRLDVPDLAVRPATDRVREAVFSMLADWIAGRAVLDLYAGTGSYGLEAISRGAKSVVFVEADPRVVKYLEKNIQRCGLGKTEAEVLHTSAETFFQKDPAPGMFDLVFADPPYTENQEGMLLQNTLQALEAGAMLHLEGLLVFEQPREACAAVLEGWDMIRDRAYGKSRILLYRRKG